MRKRLAALFVTLGLGVVLVSVWDVPPSNEDIERVWREEVVAAHMQELMRLIGPQAYDFIVFEDFEVKEVKSLSNGQFRALYLFKLRLTQPLDALAGEPSGNALGFVRAIFPEGNSGDTSTASGSLKLEKMSEGWHSI